MTFSRNKLFVVFLGILFLFYLLNRINRIVFWDYTTGEVVGTHRIKSISRWGNSSTPSPTDFTHPIVEFAVDGKYYAVDGEENVNYNISEKVDVIYNPRNPDKANIFSFMGFWWEALMYTILLPGFLGSVALFSFLQKKDQIIINLKGMKVKLIRNEDEEERKDFYESLKGETTKKGLH